MPVGVYKRTDEHRRNMGLSRKGKKLSEEWRKKVSEGIKKAYAEGRIERFWKGTKGPMYGKKFSKESRLKMSLAKLGKPSHKKDFTVSNETRKKISKSLFGRFRGKDNPNWKGGEDKRDYSVDWTETLRRSIRERDRYICFLCNAAQGDLTHDVHHIDYNKKNCSPENLITLCHYCHPKTNHNRDYWFKFFQEKCNKLA